MPKTVCIVSPGNLASNPRLLKEADALHGAGYAVTAVVCDYTEELRGMDDEIAARVPWTVVRVPRPFGERAVTTAAERLARMVVAVGASVPPELAARASGGPVSTLRQAARGIRADSTLLITLRALRPRRRWHDSATRCWASTPRISIPARVPAVRTRTSA